jgi:hypothetical protein
MNIPEGVTKLTFGDDVMMPRLKKPFLGASSQGKFVSVRPVGAEHGGKTFLGIYLGDLTLGLTAKRDGDAMVVSRAENMLSGNPCIYVPDLNQLVFGVESWWGVINSPDDLRQISDADIQNVWYVQALKALGEGAAQA